jgi:hypothetical protein
MNSFFTLHSFLEVGKTQDLPSKFWQTLGDGIEYIERLNEFFSKSLLDLSIFYLKLIGLVLTRCNRCIEKSWMNLYYYTGSC